MPVHLLTFMEQALQITTIPNPYGYNVSDVKEEVGQFGLSVLPHTQCLCVRSVLTTTITTHSLSSSLT